ncbi:MAG: iron-sulfur cluster assembly accessory protein [Gammaproteobacteria bacterium]|nr:iron-sulfur cluster assembly accessory protein [Gammaproteobacteria bacterium]
MSAVQFDRAISDQVKVSAEAAIQLKQLVDAEDGIAGVRVFVAGGGCGGMNYGMTFVEDSHDFDCILEQDGLKVFVDAVALGFLEGVEIDYKEQGANRSFVFQNVFQSVSSGGSCGGCGSSGGGCA